MSTEKDSIAKLKAALLEASPRTLENLTANLLGRLIGLHFRRAKGGSQQGGDGGVHGIDGRNLIFEARRYGESSRLNDREIRGEISQAVDRDPALEVWILVTTQEVSEQTASEIQRAGRQFGIDTLFLDWSPSKLPRLAALCASDPDSFEAEIGGNHRHLLEHIKSLADYHGVLKSIRDEMKVHAIGFDLLRTASHELVRDIWSDRDKAQARFNQNVAGGAHGASCVSRAESIAQLHDWFCAKEQDCRGLIVGGEGMGKTWVAFSWLHEELDQLPIVILVPSSSIGGPIAGYDALIELLAGGLRDLDRSVVRELEYWKRRVVRLLQGPAADGPAFLIFFDGLNEKPSLDWVALLSHWQDEPFNAHTRVLVSVRESFLSERMRNLSGLGWQPTRIEVGPYDLTLGGEFDQKLAMAGLTRKDLPQSLIDLARVPRLFDLVIQLRERLGNVQKVTIHRLLWEYGASAVPLSAFGKHGWRQFVLTLASEFRAGRNKRDLAEVEEITATATAPQDQIYQRVSSVVDGVFTRLSQFGELQFEPDFVRHALGLALVKTLEDGQTDAVQEELERFLGPIAGHDERAEVVRAAVSITLATNDNLNLPAYLSALCSSWVQSQNLPEEHVAELGILAPQLVDPLLSAIEHSAGRASSSPRHIAENALFHVDRSDRAVARAIAAKGAQWCKAVSLERRYANRANDENSVYTQRRQRLEARIGLAQVGTLVVLGRVVEIVEQTNSGLAVVAAQLLQGRPLIETTEFFEAAALNSAITGTGYEENGWLNALNTVDPVETAASLRSISENTASRQPEPGVHADLGRRVAAILLWWTGFEEDASKASALNPGLDHWLSYEKDYLPDPGKSLIRLERRHATPTLSRNDIAPQSRIDRTKYYLGDPSLSIPECFSNELVVASERLDFDKMSASVSTTAEDWAWRDFSLALARCTPSEFTRIVRTRIRNQASRGGEPRFGAARDVLDSMLIVTKAERSALHVLRTTRPSKPDNREWLTQRNLLIAEIQGESPARQIQKIVESDIEFIDAALSRACSCPSTSDLDSLVRQYHSAPERLFRVAKALTEKKVKVSDQAFGDFLRLLDDGSRRLEFEPLWIFLGRNSPEQLGAVLEERGWSWSANKPYMENIMGSEALAAANRHAPFSQFAPRLAPVTLLGVLHKREFSKKDVQSAAELLNLVIFRQGQTPPETRLDVSHDREAASEQADYLFSVGDIRSDNDDGGKRERFLERMRAPEEYEQRRQEIGKRYFEEVMESKRAGAHFLLKFENPDHFDKVLEYCPEAVESWLEGIDSESSSFVRRIQMADGFFVSLCEAMLARGEERGVLLWHKLRKHLHTRFTIFGDMDRLVYALTGAAPTAEAERALEELYQIEQTANDKELVNLVVAARLSDRLTWLRRMVARDKKSPSPVHRKRAAFLEPLLMKPSIANESAWPEGETTDITKETAWILAQREAFGYHWLLTFAKADTVEEAHAAWHLFLACADRRAWSWMGPVLNSHKGNNVQCEEAKRSFLSQQKQRLIRAMTDNEKHWKDNFGGKRYSKWLFPWNGRE